MHYLFALWLMAQGPTPETAATLFPGGGYVSYNSVFGTRPSRPHEGIFAAAVAARRDVQISMELPVTTLDSGRNRKTSIGDALATVKYRFLRIDSERGTTQASVAVGPRFASNVTDSPAVIFFNGSFTYTGLFHIKKLIADISTDYLIRNDEIDSRLWLSYRPYQSNSVGAEWWIGPSVSWQHNVVDRGTVLSPGAVTYVSPAPGLILWTGIEFPESNRRWSFGVTRQFRLPGR